MISMKWPSNHEELFYLLGLEAFGESMQNIKTDSSKRSTGRKFVESIVAEFASAVGEEDFDDDILEYLTETKSGNKTLYQRVKERHGIVEDDYKKEHVLLDNIEANVVKLVQLVQGRKGRGVVQQLILDILDRKDVKENIILLQKAISNKSSEQMRKIRKRYLIVKSKVVELIKIIEENQDTINEKSFLSPEKVNINQSMFRLSLKANEVEEDDLISMQKQANTANWKRTMTRGTITYSKLFPSKEISTQELARRIIQAQLPLIEENKSYNTTFIVDNSDLRELLIQNDQTLKNMSSTEQIESRPINDLVAEENIDENIVENYFNLLRKGFSDAPAMKSITDFKINGTEMYNKILNADKGKKTYSPSLYLIKVLNNASDANLFKLTMAKNAQESILPERTYRAFRSQKSNWVETYRGERNPAEKDTTNIDYKEYIEGYKEMTDRGLYSVNLIDYINREKDNEGNPVIKVPEDKMEIINPDAKKDLQLVNVDSGFKSTLEKLIDENTGSVSRRRRYKAWLNENNLEDSIQTKTSRYIPEYPDMKNVDLSKESILVQTIYAILDRGPLMKFLGSPNELKDMFKIFNIERGLKTYYHIINLMTATDLIPDARKIDSLRHEEGEDSLADNASLLTAVKSFATKLDSGLIQFKEAFKKALGARLKDIETNPTNYLVIHKSTTIKNKLIRFQLMDRRETNDSG